MGLPVVFFNTLIQIFPKKNDLKIRKKNKIVQWRFYRFKNSLKFITFLNISMDNKFKNYQFVHKIPIDVSAVGKPNSKPHYKFITERHVYDSCFLSKFVGK